MTKQCYVSRGAGGVGCDCETHPWLTFQSPQIGIHAYCPIKVTVGHSILNWSDLNSVFPTWIFLRKLVQRSSLRKVTGLLHHTVLFHQSVFIRHRFWQSFLVKLFSLNPPLVPRIAAASEPPPSPLLPSAAPQSCCRYSESDTEQSAFLARSPDSERFNARTFYFFFLLLFCQLIFATVTLSRFFSTASIHFLLSPFLYFVSLSISAGRTAMGASDLTRPAGLGDD